MVASEILELVKKGETSSVQFKLNVNNELSIAQKMVAFANTKGDTILIGIDDKTWNIIGLTTDDLRRLTNLLVSAADQHVEEPIFINTETVEVEGRLVMIVTVPQGISKPRGKSFNSIGVSEISGASILINPQCYGKPLMV